MVGCESFDRSIDLGKGVRGSGMQGLVGVGADQEQRHRGRNAPPSMLISPVKGQSFWCAQRICVGKERKMKPENSARGKITSSQVEEGLAGWVDISRK